MDCEGLGSSGGCPVFITPCGGEVLHFCRVRKPRISESEFLGNSLWTWGFHPLLPVEVRCEMFVERCRARSAQCNTMSHLSADAGFSYNSRETPDVTPCHTSPPQGVRFVIVLLNAPISTSYFLPLALLQRLALLSPSR